MAELEMSEMAWGILDRLSWGRDRGTVEMDFDKVAPGPRGVLIFVGAAEKVLHKPAGRQSFRHKAKPAVYHLVITEAGKKLLAERKAAVSDQSESA